MEDMIFLMVTYPGDISVGNRECEPEMISDWISFTSRDKMETNENRFQLIKVLKIICFFFFPERSDTARKMHETFT